MHRLATTLKYSICAGLVCLFLSSPAFAEKLVTAKYSVHQPSANAFEAAVKTLTLEKYSLRLADKSQGTIQAVKMAFGGSEYASVFISIHQTGDTTVIDATFDRHPGMVGGGSPKKLATVFANDLRKIFPDLIEST